MERLQQVTIACKRLPENHVILFTNRPHGVLHEVERDIAEEFLALDADIVFLMKNGLERASGELRARSRDHLVPSNGFIGFAGSFLFLLEMHPFKEGTNERDYWMEVYLTRHKDKGTFSSQMACLDRGNISLIIERATLRKPVIFNSVERSRAQALVDSERSLDTNLSYVFVVVLLMSALLLAPWLLQPR